MQLPIAAPRASQARTMPRTRQFRLYHRAVRISARVADLALINVAFIAAYYLRYWLEVGGYVVAENFVELSDYLPLQAGISVTLFAVYQLTGLYRAVGQRPFLQETWDILSSTTFGMTLFFGIVFLVRSFAYSRGLFLLAWALAIVLLILSRVVLRMVHSLLRRRGIGVRRVLVVGGEPIGLTVMHVLATEPGLGYHVAGFVHHSGADLGRFRCLGSMDDLPEIVREHEIDEVVVALPSADHLLVPSIAEQCAREGAALKIVPDLFELSLGLGQVNVEDLRGIPVIGPREVTIQGSDLLLKRAMDVAGALAAIIVLAPFWIACAVLIKLSSPGPVLFSQVRLGRDGRPFRALKFRSMRVGAEAELARLRRHNEASGPLFKMRNDPRVTWIGRWLRRTSLDELPQVLNVLRGEMSLVGPRPPLPSEVKEYQEWHQKRLKVAPGMTGLWQVSGRSELPFDEMVLLDIYYIENWSLGLDFQILLRTLPAVVTGRGAY